VYRPKIYFTGESEDDLIALEETAYGTESVLQELLVKYPDLLPGDQINPENPRRWLLVAREMGVPGDVTETGRWSLDHLFLDQDGIPTFVECKRAEDTRIRREVVTQMLDYAANGIAYWSMDRLRQSAAETTQKLGKSLDQEIVLLLGEASGEIDIEGYWEKVEANLRGHRVRLVFVADSTPRELRRLVEFLNEEMKNVEVFAVEIKRFQGSGDKEQFKALVPRVVGLTEAARTTKGSTSTERHQWTDQEFFAVLSENVEPGIADIVKDLYEWSSNRADRIWFGTGAERGSFTFHYLVDGKTVSVFSVYTGGQIVINYGWLSRQIQEVAIAQFHSELNKIPGFEHIPADFARWPSVSIAVLSGNPASMNAFKQAVLELRANAVLKVPEK
jgi:hypothetical protein